MKMTVNDETVKQKGINDWLCESSLSDLRRSQRLTGFAIAVLAARAALANSKLSIEEYQFIADITKDLSTLSDEESSVAANFALLSGQSRKLVGTCVEVVTFELDEFDFITLLDRLTEILTLDQSLCERDVEYLFEIYIRTCEAMSVCAFRNRAEKSRYCDRVLSFIRKQSVKFSGSTKGSDNLTDGVSRNSGHHQDNEANNRNFYERIPGSKRLNTR